jgi:hypothetical protein
MSPLSASRTDFADRESLFREIVTSTVNEISERRCADAGDPIDARPLGARPRLVVRGVIAGVAARAVGLADGYPVALACA